jgi:osmotically-inducible protein OsmY
MNSTRQQYLAVLLTLGGALCACAGFPHPTPQDAKITAQLQSRLRQYPDLNGPSQVYVQTLRGVVYLTGHVLTQPQLDTVESEANATPGVTRVVDNVTVRANTGI